MLTHKVKNEQKNAQFLLTRLLASCSSTASAHESAAMAAVMVILIIKSFVNSSKEMSTSFTQLRSLHGDAQTNGTQVDVRAEVKTWHLVPGVSMVVYFSQSVFLV